MIKDELKLNQIEANWRNNALWRSSSPLSRTATTHPKRAVHPARCSVGRAAAEGIEVPKEIFGVYQQRRAVIKLARK